MLIFIVLSILSVFLGLVLNNLWLLVISFGFFYLYITTYLADIKIRLNNVKGNLTTILISLVPFLILLLYTFRFNSVEISYIPSWDHVNYWKKVLSFGFDSNIKETLNKLYISILYDDYSDFPSFLLKPATSIFGIDRANYIMGILLTFKLPTIFIFILIYKKLFGSNNYNILSSLLISAIVCFLPYDLMPVITGYLDIVGMLFILPLLFTFTPDFYSRFNVKKVLIVSILLLLAAFSRRWYLYFVFTYFVSIGLYNIISIITLKRKLKELFIITLNLGSVVVVTFFVLFIFFNKFFERSFLTDYKDMYSAYQATDFIGNINYVFLHIGFIQLLIVVLALYISFKVNKNIFNLLLVLLVQVVIMTLMIIQWLSFGWHQYILFLPLFILSSLVILINNRASSWFGHILFKTFFVIVLLFNFIVPFNIYGSGNSIISKLYSNSRVYPSKRDDYYLIKQMAKDFDQITNGGEKKIYIVCSGYKYNEDVFRNVNFPYSFNSISGLAKYHTAVDKRDKFSPDFYDSDYILAFSPDQLHLTHGQEFVKLMGKLMLGSDTIWKSSFQQIRSYNFPDGTMAYLFEKVKPLSAKQLKMLEKELELLYPSEPNLTKVNYLQGLMFDKQSTGQYSKIEFFPWTTILSFHSGIGSPTKFSLNTIGLDSVYLDFSMPVNNSCPPECTEIGFFVTNSVGDTIFQKEYKGGTLETAGIKVKDNNFVSMFVTEGKHGPCCDDFFVNDFRVVFSSDPIIISK